MNVPSPKVFVVLLAATVGMTLFLIQPLEAWAALPILAMTTVLLVSARWPLDHARLILGIAGVSLSLFLCAAGLFMGVLFMFGHRGQARPCPDGCQSDPMLLVAAVAAMIVAAVVLVFTLRSVVALVRTHDQDEVARVPRS